MAEFDGLVFRYKGQRLEAQKLAGAGTHRSKSAVETLSAIRPIFGHAGITRLADITDLDRIGVPVTLAIRPNSRTLAVSSGKSTDLSSALTSGAMESLELYHAEYSEPRRIICTYEELVADHQEIPYENLPLREGSLFNTRWPETWIEGWNLLSQQQVGVPVNTVLMSPPIKPELPSIAAFVTDSNGLASGNNLIEATLSGLYEVIERDAVTLHKFVSLRHGHLVRKLDLTTVPFESVHRLNRQIQESGTDLLVFDCTSDLSIPTYRAMLLDSRRGPASIVEGFGTHLCAELALVRAITEACQGRAVVISGARDDIFNFALEKLRHIDSSLHFQGLLDMQGEAFSVQGYETDTQTLHGDAHVVLQAIKAAGFDQAIVVELKIFDCEQSFVKVVVPGLEGYQSHGYKAGRRACAAQGLDSQRGNAAKRALPLEPFHFPAGGDPR